MKTKKKPDTILVEVDYIKKVYSEVCGSWKIKISEKFPQLKLSNVGKFFIHEDGDVILITRHPNEGILVKSGNGSIGRSGSWVLDHFKPYKGPKIDLNKVFNNL